MAKKSIKDSELQSLLQEIETDLQKAYEVEKNKLVKADDDDKKPLPGEASDSVSESAAPGASDDAAPAPAADDAPPQADEAPAADASAAPEAGGEPDPAAEGQEAPLDPAALQAEYAQLSPESLDMHLKAALSAKAAQDAAAAPPAPAAPEAPAPAAPPAAPPVAKEEVKDVNKEALGGKEVPVKKSEVEDNRVAELEKIVKSQSEDIENLVKSLKIFMGTPLRKAVTSVAYLPKVEAAPKEYSRNDVNKLIAANVHKLTKSERDLVSDFYDRKVPASSLEGILEKLTSNK